MDVLRNVLSRLAALVPGYAGYAEREKRRETDQALRLAIAARIGAAHAAVDRRIAECARTQRFENLEPLSGIARRLARLADVARHAPAGYSGLFDAAEVDAAALDRLYASDLAARESCEHLVEAVEGIPASAEAAFLESVERALVEAENALMQRDLLLSGVK